MEKIIIMIAKMMKIREISNVGIVLSALFVYNAVACVYFVVHMFATAIIIEIAAGIIISLIDASIACFTIAATMRLSNEREPETDIS